MSGIVLAIFGLGLSTFNQITQQATNIEPDPNLSPAEQGTQIALEIVNGLWEQVGNSRIYEGMLVVGKILLGIGLLFVLYRTYVEITEERLGDLRKIIGAFIWPIIVIVLLVQPPNLNGQVITSQTNIWNICLTLRNTVNFLSQVAVNGLSGQNGKNPVNVFVNNITQNSLISESVNECDSLPEASRIACLERISRGIADGSIPANSVFRNYAGNFLEAIESSGVSIATSPLPDNLGAFDPEKLVDILSNPFTKIGKAIIDNVILKILLAIYLMFSLVIELGMLLVSIVAPLAVGMSVIPLQSRSIVTFLSGFTAIGMTKIAFVTIAMLGTNFSFETNYGGFNMAVAMLLAVGAPFIAGSVGTFSASGIQQGVGYIGSIAIAAGGAGLGRAILLSRLGR